MVQSSERKVTKETHAYTPGLKIKRTIRERKVRKLPIQGEVFVKVGDEVDFQTEVSKTTVPGEPHVMNAAAKLGVTGETLKDYTKKKIGDDVSKGERIAGFNMFFGLWKNWVLSPADGYIENISELSGQIIVREHPVPVTVDAYVQGRVVDVLENEGAVIETNAAFVQGIFGVGGETHGEIKVVLDDPEAHLTEDLVTPNCKDKILVGGSLVTGEALHRALGVGASGIVTGGIMDVSLEDLLGYEIGVAITGQEDIGITVVITEGFGEMAMNPRTLELFKEFEGERVAMSGATQIRAGVIRPEVIIPHDRGVPKEESSLSMGMTPGTPIRIISLPYFGGLGKVISLPVELHVIETESSVRVVEVELEDGRRVIVPRANVEIIEI